MNKIFNEFLKTNSLDYDPKKGFYGKLNGFQISGNMDAFTGSNVTVNVYLTEEAAEKVSQWIESNKKKYGILNPAYSTNSVFCMINPPLGLVKKYIAFLQEITAFLAEVATPDSCPFCGEALEGSEDVRLVGTYGRVFHAHEHCFDEYAEQLSQNETAMASAPNNTLRGVLGAVVGALAGAVLWVLLYFIGYIAVVAAALASMGAAFMWGKFGGKNNKTKIAVVWVVTILMILLAMLVAYCIDVQIVINEIIAGGDEAVTNNAFEGFLILLRGNPEFRTEVIIDTLVSLIFIVVANVFTTINVLKTQKLESSTLVKY